MRYKDLLEASSSVLFPDIKSTISPTMIIPELINSDTYKQYRYTLALAAARAHKAGEIVFDAESAWNESLAAVAYTPAEQETIELANKLMNVKGLMISDSPSEEPASTQKISPVMKFNAFDSIIKESTNSSEIIRKLIDLIPLIKETSEK